MKKFKFTYFLRVWGKGIHLLFGWIGFSIIICGFYFLFTRITHSYLIYPLVFIGSIILFPIISYYIALSMDFEAGKITLPFECPHCKKSILNKDINK